jgi:hypothetical protein
MLREGHGVAEDLALAPASTGAMAGAAGVLGDREEPARLCSGDDPAPEATVGPHERGLGDILGLLAAAEVIEAIAEDAVVVALVEDSRIVGGRLHLTSRRAIRDERRIRGHASPCPPSGCAWTLTVSQFLPKGKG